MNLYHKRQLYNTLIPLSRESPAVGLRISRLSGPVELILRYTTPDIRCRHRRHECDGGIIANRSPHTRRSRRRARKTTENSGRRHSGRPFCCSWTRPSSMSAWRRHISTVWRRRRSAVAARTTDWTRRTSSCRLEPRLGSRLSAAVTPLCDAMTSVLTSTLWTTWTSFLSPLERQKNSILICAHTYKYMQRYENT